MVAPVSKTDVHDTTPPSAPVPITAPLGPRAAAERVVSGDSVTVRMDGRELNLPPGEQLAFLAGLGLLVALDLIEWPIALAIAVGHELAHSHHGRMLREFGEALEEA